MVIAYQQSQLTLSFSLIVVLCGIYLIISVLFCVSVKLVTWNIACGPNKQYRYMWYLFNYVSFDHA